MIGVLEPLEPPFHEIMPFSHHSHSGQFCGHGENTLEEVVQAAIDKKMQVFALTEHMPREERDLYPEEVLPSLPRKGFLLIGSIDQIITYYCHTFPAVS